MKKTAILFLISLSLPSLLPSFAAADQPFAKFIGCYKTVSIDGTPVTDEPTNVFSQIYASQDGWYRDTDGQALPSTNFTLYREENSDAQSFYTDFAEAFNSAGQCSEDSSGEHYSFDGDVTASGYAEDVHLYAKIDVQPAAGAGDEILVHLSTVLTDTLDPPYALDTVHRLKPVACP